MDVEKGLMITPFAPQQSRPTKKRRILALETDKPLQTDVTEEEGCRIGCGERVD